MQAREGAKLKPSPQEKENNKKVSKMFTILWRVPNFLGKSTSI